MTLFRNKYCPDKFGFRKTVQIKPENPKNVGNCRAERG